MTDRLVHPERGEAEYVLTVYCDDPSHPERVVDRIGYWSSPEPRPVGFLNWLSQFDSLQTPFGEKLKAELRSGAPVDLGGWSGTPKDMDYGTRWRFECPGCRTVPVSGRKMETVLHRLRDHGVARISLPEISARL